MSGTDLSAGRGPQYALVIYGSHLGGSATLYSDPNEKQVVADAEQRNQKAVEQGKPTRYLVERRVPVSLGLLFDGSSWSSREMELESLRRNNGC